MKNISKVFIITLFVLLGVSCLSLFAQENKDDISKKMKQLIGNVDKITVQVDGKEVVFEGKEAADLIKNLKMVSKKPGMSWFSKDGNENDSSNSKTIVLEVNEDKADLNDEENGNKKVEIRIDDGMKKVTVTSSKDGKEETKIYEGDEAEKYLKENEKTGKIRVFENDDEDGHGNFVFYSSKLDNNDCCCCGNKMNMKRMKRDGNKVKKIIIEEHNTSDKEESEIK